MAGNARRMAQVVQDMLPDATLVYYRPKFNKHKAENRFRMKDLITKKEAMDLKDAIEVKKDGRLSLELMIDLREKLDKKLNSITNGRKRKKKTCLSAHLMMTISWVVACWWNRIPQLSG